MTSQQAKILVADDEESIRRIFRRALGKDFDVCAVGNGSEALERMACEYYDVIFLDMKMPRVNGLDVLKKLDEENYPHGEIVLMTGYADPEATMEAVRLGANELLLKPFEITGLEMMTQRALERKRIKGSEGKLKKLIKPGTKPRPDSLDSTVLVVDDDPDVIAVARVILELKGYAVSAATYIAEVFNRVVVEKPLLILLDAGMPGMDGYEFCRSLKSRQETKNIPVVFVSARIRSEDKRKAMECGANAYLEKPFAAQDLVRLVEEYLKL